MTFWQAEAIPTDEVWHRYIPKQKLISVFQHGDDYFLRYRYGVGTENPYSAGFYLKSGMQYTLDREFYSEAKLMEKRSSITLPSGESITLKSSDRRQPQRCPQTLNFYYEVEESGEVLSQKTLLYILDEPRVTPISSRCVDTQDPSVTEYVSTVSGLLIDLENGEYLMHISDLGLVIRFDKNHNTQSDLLGGKIAVLDTSEYRSLLVREAETYNYQESQNNIYEYLQGWFSKRNLN